MYRVQVNGSDYHAPDLSTLQQWANEGRILPESIVFVEALHMQQPASQVQGLVFANRSPYAQPPVGAPAAYPRESYGYPASYEKVPNNLVLAILATVLCCMPFGIVSIIYAAQVDNLASRGEMAKARDSAEKAKGWAIASAICGFIGTIAWIALMVMGGIN